MRRSFLAIVLLTVVAALAAQITTPVAPLVAQESSHTLTFSTYLGGSDDEQARDVDTDAAGNIYVVGGTKSANFPFTNPTAYYKSVGYPCNPAPASGGPTLSVQVVAPDGVLWSGDAAIVSVPSASGSLGIMARHEPLAAALVAGPVRVRPLTGEVHEIAITGGFVVVDADEVTVLVDAVVVEPAAG